MDALAAVSEVVAWIALGSGALFAVIFGALRLARGPWDSSPAAVVDGELRWMTDDGGLHTNQGWADHPETEDLVVYYRTRQPDVPHLEPVAHDERAFRFVALVTMGLAVIAFIIGAVAPVLG